MEGTHSRRAAVAVALLAAGAAWAALVFAMVTLTGWSPAGTS